MEVNAGFTTQKPAIRRLAVFTDPPQPVPKLQRPVLLIPGGESRRIGLSTITHYLTHGSENSFGGSYNVDKRAEFEQTYKEHGGNVFCLHYSHKFASFEHNAREIKQAVDDIRRLTGHDEIDVVAECKGSQEFRQYISEGNDGVRNVVLMVPPNNGLPVAGDFLRVVAGAIEKLHLPVKKLGKIELDKESLTAMQSFPTDWSLGPFKNNPRAARYNAPENVAREKAAFHSLTVIGGDGENLFEKWGMPGLPFPAYRGDQSVPKWSAYLPHGENFFYSGKRAAHAQVNSNPLALAKTAEALVTDGNPTRDEHYVAEPPKPANRVMLRSAVWVAGFAGRVGMLDNAVTGAIPGPVGLGLAWFGAGAAAFDGLNQIKHVVEGEQPVVKGSVGALGKLASSAGVVLALTGAATGRPVAVLIAGGIVASAYSWT